MHLAVAELIANALADSTIGVNTVLDSIPRGDHRRPPNAQVYVETRDGWVSRLELAEVPPEGVELPGLVVVLGGPITWLSKGRPTRDVPSQTANQATAGIHYLTREVDTAVGVADSILSLRAARGVLNILAQPDFVALRTLYGVRLETIVETQYARLFTPIEDVILAGSLLTTWTARETLPHYTP